MHRKLRMIRTIVTDFSRFRIGCFFALFNGRVGTGLAVALLKMNEERYLFRRMHELIRLKVDYYHLGSLTTSYFEENIGDLYIVSRQIEILNGENTYPVIVLESLNEYLTFYGINVTRTEAGERVSSLIKKGKMNPRKNIKFIQPVADNFSESAVFEKRLSRIQT